MQTTIQIDKSTVQVLSRLKAKYNARSYDELIKKVLQKEEKVPESMFGAHPDLKPFKRQEDDFHDL